MVRKISITIAVIGLVVLGAARDIAQAPTAVSSTPAEFEVATIKAADPTHPIGIRRLPGGLFVTSNTSLRLLITWAYDIGDERLTGAPGWLDSARFDVVAKASDLNPNLARGQLQLMVQTLLAERFKLQIHREHKELPIYILELDRGGPKVHVLGAGAVSQNPFKMNVLGRLSGTGVTTTMLAKVLSGQLGRYVEDKTGFTSVFEFTLVWRPDAASPADMPSEDDVRPSIFTAIREQLGFQLISAKGPVEVIAIDHIEHHPTEN
jgi:uncharacterized protein (TIGR03435 family)